MKRKIGLKKLSYYKKRAWIQFSKYIRLSHCFSGDTVKCYTCPVVKNWQSVDAGHGIEGRGNAVLFMEEVVRPQCKSCNIFKHGNLRIFTINLIEELGRKKYNRLVIESNKIIKYTRHDYIEICEKYKKEVENLE